MERREVDEREGRREKAARAVNFLFSFTGCEVGLKTLNRRQRVVHEPALQGGEGGPVRERKVERGAGFASARAPVPCSLSPIPSLSYHCTTDAAGGSAACPLLPPSGVSRRRGPRPQEKERRVVPVGAGMHASRGTSRGGAEASSPGPGGETVASCMVGVVSGVAAAHRRRARGSCRVKRRSERSRSRRALFSFTLLSRVHAAQRTRWPPRPATRTSPARTDRSFLP